MFPKVLSPSSVLMCVVDEADHVASIFSRPMLENILSSLTNATHRPQIVLVGATRTKEIPDISQQFQKKCVNRVCVCVFIYVCV